MVEGAVNTIHSGFLSPVALSCLFTKGLTATKDYRQAVPETYKVPDEGTRLLCARLIIEEALETIKALGISVRIDDSGRMFFKSRDEPDLMGIIDGCCDTIYVATGTLCAVGAPDVPHLKEICRANDSKFPNGKVTVDEATGKYLKPAGWVGPDHDKIRNEMVNEFRVNLLALTDEVTCGSRFLAAQD